MAVIAFSSAVGPIPLTCVISESHRTEIEITGNPIETGAEVNDHAYILPRVVQLEYADENAVATLAALRRLQESRVPFTLVTGLAVYQNMLLKTVGADRDKDWSRTLRGSIDLQEVIIVETSYAAAEGVNDHPDAGNTKTRAARPSPRKTSGVAVTRSAGTVTRGDSPIKTVPIPTARATVKGLIL